MVNVSTMNLETTLTVHLGMVKLKQHGNGKASRTVLNI
jgi:hypothetical protein